MLYNQTAPITGPTLVYANYKNLHITYDGQRTCCNIKVSDEWAVERDGDHHMNRCPRCGDAGAFAELESMLREAKLAREAQRVAEQGRRRQKDIAERKVQRNIEEIIASALGEHGYDVLMEKLPGGVRVFVYSQTEYGDVNFQVSTVVANEVAERAKARIA